MRTDVQQPRVRGFRTIRSRMLFWVLVVTVPIYALALSMSFQATAQQLEQGAARDADELAARLAADLDTVIRPIEGGIRTVGRQLEEVNPPPEQYPQRIHGILAAWPEIYGSTIAVEVGDADPRPRPFAPYYFRRDGAIAYSDLALDSYGYRELPWYRRAADSRQPVWSLPYFDTGGGETWMVTYSVPYFRKVTGGRVFAGVITADLDLNWVRSAAKNITLGSNAAGWLTSPPATESFVAPLGASAQRLGGFADWVNEEKLRALAEEMLAKRDSFALLPKSVAVEPTFLAVRKLETLNWRLIIAIPRSQLLAGARQLLVRQLWLGVAGLLLLITAISLVAAGVSRPIHLLADAVDRAEEGNLDFHLPEAQTRDETGVLTAALRRLRDSLKTHVQLRAETLAAQARLEHELQIAASIQQSMLPRHDAASLPRAAQVAAALVPAKQVGGDLFDYFSLRDGSLLFAVGDVSDKGIPAALFMARMTSLLRVLGNAGGSPDRLLVEINSKLVDGNDACMFVTVACGVLDVTNGQVRIACAGHEAPLVRRLDGSVIPMAVENGPALGIDVAVEYRLSQGFVAPGDTLVLYTDGVTEAESRHGALFGVERLASLLGEPGDENPAALVQRIVRSVATDSGDFRATDDVAVLAISFCPPTIETQRVAGGESWRIEVVATSGGIRQAQQWLRSILAARDIIPERVSDAELIAEELLTNILRANETRAARVAISMECVLLESEIVLTFRDDGQAFDPLGRDAPRLEGDAADRSIGGLGIHLVRELADGARYAHVDGLNVLTIHLHRMPASHGVPT